MITLFRIIIEPVYDSNWNWAVNDEVNYMKYRHISYGDYPGHKVEVQYKIRYKEEFSLKDFVEESVQYYRRKYPDRTRIEIEYRYPPTDDE